MSAMDIENNLKYGLTRSHFCKVSCFHNEDKKKEQYHVQFSTTYHNDNTPAIMKKKIEISNQNVCVENNEPIENKDTYICDDTIARSISEFDRNEQCDDIIEEGIVTSVNSCNDDFVHDDVANVSRHQVSISESQFYVNEEAKIYVSNDDFNVADPTFRGEIV